jgi:hypothetical protein
VAREAEIILASFESKNAVVPVGVVWLEKIAGEKSVRGKGGERGTNADRFVSSGPPPAPTTMRSKE